VAQQAVDVRLATSGLDINAAYTVWWIVFNNPSACTGGCGADDLGNPATAASAFYAAGFVTRNGRHRKPDRAFPRVDFRRASTCSSVKGLWRATDIVPRFTSLSEVTVRSFREW